jgi:adenine phosphoribosyltransferase
MRELIERDVTHSNLDFIIAPEAMGIPIATIVSTLMDRPYLVVRKRKYDLPGELEVQQITGYSKSLMYINSINLYSNVIIVDDVVSTGGTLKAIIDELKLNNINILGSYTIIEKDGAAKRLRDQGYNVKSLVNVIMGKDCISNIIASK